jgi:hypothetical protein
VLVLAAVLTFLVALAGYDVSLSQFQHQPLWAEHWGRHYTDGSFSRLAADDGRLHAMVEAILNNDRHLLHLLLPLAFYPELLASPMALMLVTVPALGMLLAMLGLYVLKRSSQPLPAMAAMVLMAAAPGLLNRLWGVGSPVQDIPAALLFTAGVLLLLLPTDTADRRRSLLPVILLLCASILTRTPAVFISAFTLTLIVIADLVACTLAGGSLRSAGTYWLKLVAGVGAVVAIPIGVSFEYLWAYYTRLKPAADQFDQFGYLESAKTVGTILADFFGPVLVTILGLLLVLACYRILRNLRTQGLAAFHQDAALLAWGLGLPAMLVANKYWSAMPKELLYSIPALVALGFATAKWKSPARWLDSTGAQLLLALVVGSLLIHLNYAREMANTLAAEKFETDWQNSQREMSKAIASVPGDLLIWQSYTLPDWWADVTSMTLFEHGVVRIPAGHDYFANQHKYWTAHYRGVPENQLPALVYKRTLECVDIAVVLNRPNTTSPMMKDKLAIEIARYMATKVASDGNWKLHSVLTGVPWGAELAVYVKNTRSAPHCYRNALLGMRPDTGHHRFSDGEFAMGQLGPMAAER